MYLLIKFSLSAGLIVAISELAKRSSLMGAILASLPMVSLLAMIWLYHETGDTQRIAVMSTGIFWLVLPSLMLFLVLPVLLKAQWGFYPALLAGSACTVAAYGLMVLALKHYGVEV